MTDSTTQRRPVTRICRAVRIEVPSLPDAAEDYCCLLRSEPIARDEGFARFGLRGVALDLRGADVPAARITQVLLAAAEGGEPASPLPEFLFAQMKPVPDDAPVALDMVCYMTRDSANARKRFAVDPLRLEAARTMCLGSDGAELSFFKLGTTLLELIGNPAAPGDGFWGLSFRVEDIEEYHSYLTRCGVDVSGIRKGRKPGTRVATVRSRNLGLPTLLLGPERT